MSPAYFNTLISVVVCIHALSRVARFDFESDGAHNYAHRLTGTLRLSSALHPWGKGSSNVQGD